MPSISPGDLTFQPMDQAKGLDVFEVERFADGFGPAYDELDGWLKSDVALAHHLEGRITTAVASYEGHVAGFIATHVHGLRNDHDGVRAQGFTKPFPCLKVLHLASDRRFKGCRVGRSLLLTHGIAMAAVISRFTGIRFVYLDAIHPARSFYESVGFVSIEGKKKHAFSTPMVFDLYSDPASLQEFREIGMSHLQQTLA